MNEIYFAFQQASVEKIILVIIILLVFYFLPTFVAVALKKKSIFRFFVINLTTAWTFAVWFALLVWAVSAKKSEEPDNKKIE